VALLRVSSKALGDEVDLAATIGQGDGGVEHGLALARFGESATRGDEHLPDARGALQEAVGSDGLVLAAATVGIFNGLVRTADATGIPLDDGTFASSVGFREKLGLNEFPGAASSLADRSRPADGSGDDSIELSPSKLFGFD
jgi:hypothetical protein